MKKALLYIRVSTQEQAKEGYSIGEQEERLKAYCKAHGWKVARIFTDGGYSGGNTRRPALTELISAVENHQADTVLVYKLDRLSRSQKDTLTLIDLFLQNNCDFVSMTENFDTSSPFGRAMIGILSVFAQLEREQIKERMTMGKEGRAKEGKWRGGGNVPIGYIQKDGLLVVNKFEAMQIRELHRLFQQGVPVYRICNEFTAKGYTHNNKAWQPRTAKRVLLNPLYTGKIIHHDSIYDGQHEAIIDEETFNKSVALMNSKPHMTRPSKSTYLGGLLYCAHCGGRYGVKGWSKNGKDYRRYSCYSRNKTIKSMIVDPNCRNKNWNKDELDDLIIGEIKKLKIDKNFKELIKAPEKNNKLIMKELDKLDAQKSRFLDLYGLGNYTLEELQKKVDAIMEKREKLEKELIQADLSVSDAQVIINSFDDVLNNGNFNEIKSLIDALIERIEIDNDDVTIYWRFS